MRLLAFVAGLVLLGASIFQSAVWVPGLIVGFLLVTGAAGSVLGDVMADHPYESRD